MKDCRFNICNNWIQNVEIGVFCLMVYNSSIQEVTLYIPVKFIAVSLMP